MSERAEPGSRISLLVLIALAPHESPSAPLKSFAVPRTGRTVTVTVSVHGLVPNGDLEQELFVPFSADSEPVRFGFTAQRIGLHPVMVRAFSGGTFLGELLLQVSVEPGSTVESPRRRTSAVGGLAAEPGEVTLQVSRTDDDRYSFQLIGEALYPVEMTKRLAGDPAQLVASIAEELRAMSAQSSPFSSPELIRRRIKNLGAQLWSDVVPQEIRRQFWEQGDRIKLFTIASDMDTVPWELLYPVDGVNDNGFLVEQFPVVRRVYGQGRARRLPLSSAAYVVPPRSPANAMDEVSGVRGILPSTVRDRGVCASLEGLIQLLESAPSVLHFACHNAFAEKSGSVISLDGGPLRPSDLAVAVQQSGLAAASPLVFFNACRTAGEVQGLVQMMGWAKQFMGAGASAFIGSLWAVRSPTAKAFAQEFYRALITDQLPLGTASLQARQAISGDAGDPTWLAYTVYGNPSASVTDAPQS
jgi:CHAT domain